MRIDSGKIGMESARRYASVTGAGKSALAQGGVLVNKGFFGSYVNSWSNGFGALRHGQGNMLGLRGERTQVYSMQSVRSDGHANALEQVREKSILYLMELFFGRHRGTARDGLLYGADNGGGMQGDGSMHESYSIQESYVVQQEVQIPDIRSRILFPYAWASPIMNMAGVENISYAEQEQTSFHTQGKVVTKDGREIDFGIDMQMSRSFAEYYERRQTAVEKTFCDPLVINLDTDIAQLSDQKFMFDIDNDGILDRISQLSAGSGYLALDKNGDGRINDGGELFGTQSGNGFADLAAYDDDGDGWIDEDDEIFDRLVIWAKDENGKDKLYHLKEKGIGAICLSSAATEFALKSGQTNETNGMIRRTGMFLFENGKAGTVQHVDLVK